MTPGDTTGHLLAICRRQHSQPILSWPTELSVLSLKGKTSDISPKTNNKKKMKKIFKNTEMFFPLIKYFLTMYATFAQHA